jgi:hypothetical protein
MLFVFLFLLLFPFLLLLLLLQELVTEMSSSICDSLPLKFVCDFCTVHADLAKSVVRSGCLAAFISAAAAISQYAAINTPTLSLSHLPSSLHPLALSLRLPISMILLNP